MTRRTALACLVALGLVSTGRGDEPGARFAARADTAVVPWLRSVKGLTILEVQNLFREEVAGLNGFCGNVGAGGAVVEAIFLRSRTVVRFGEDAQGAFRAVEARRMRDRDRRVLRDFFGAP